MSWSLSCFASPAVPFAGLSRFIRRTLVYAGTAVAAALLSGAAQLTALGQAPQYHPPVVAANGTLAGVDYDYRYEVSGGLAYTHFDAGPNLLQGANLGGIDLQGARFFTRKWAADASVRTYFGTSGVTPNPYGIRGPAVSEYMVLAGPEYRALSNEHASMTLYALFGGAYGLFSTALGRDQNGNIIGPEQVGMFNDQISFGSAIGGSIDLNRSPRLAFRISPDANLTDFSTAGHGGIKEQFAISVGLVYRLGPKIDGERPGAPRRPVH